MADQKKLSKQLISHLVFEVPSILIAVLLAIGLSSWKENNDIQASMEFSLNMVFEEIDKMGALGYVNQKNEELNQELEELIIDEANDEILMKNLYLFGISEMSMNSWQLLKNNPTYLNRMDPRMVRDLEFIYSEFLLFSAAIEKYRSFLFDHDPDMSTLKLAKYHLMYRKHIIFRSRELSSKYERIREKYPSYFEKSENN